MELLLIPVSRPIAPNSTLPVRVARSAKKSTSFNSCSVVMLFAFCLLPERETTWPNPALPPLNARRQCLSVGPHSNTTPQRLTEPVANTRRTRYAHGPSEVRQNANDPDAPMRATNHGHLEVRMFEAPRRENEPSEREAPRLAVIMLVFRLSRWPRFNLWQ